MRKSIRINHIIRVFGILILLFLTSYPLIAQDATPLTPPAAPEGVKPLELTVEDAIALTLKNNSAFQVQLLNPELRRSVEEQSKALFDFATTDTLSTSHSKGQTGASSSDTKLDLELSKAFTSGGSVGLGVTTDKSTGGTAGTNGYSTRIALSLNQKILKGAGADIVLANLHKAHLSSESSLFELQGYAESLVQNVENTYWDYAFAVKQLKIYEDSLALAQQQLDETNTLIQVGKLAEIERIASEAEVAIRQEDLINAKSAIETTRLKLLQLINPPGVDYLDQKIVVKDEIKVPETKITDVRPYIETAMVRRPDLNEARLLIQRNELDVLVTKNGLLPDLQFFAALGMTGYANSFGSSIGSDEHDWQIGVKYVDTLGRRAAKESYKQSTISKEQSDESLANLTQLARVDVASAWIELNRSFEQITATAATRKLQESKYNAEEEKYRVGKSTSILVAQAARDLLSAKIAETQAMTNYQKAVTNFLLMESMLLDKYGISFVK